MQLSRYNRRALPFLLVATVAACGDDDNPAPTEPNDPPAPNFVDLQSEPGDFLGGSGKSYRYTNTNYLYLASDVGDYLGSGMTFLFTGAYATPIITTNRGPANVGWLGLKYPVRKSVLCRRSCLKGRSPRFNGRASSARTGPASPRTSGGTPA